MKQKYLRIDLNQTISFHYFQSYAVIDRANCFDLNILPTSVDDKALVVNLFLRILFEYFRTNFDGTLLFSIQSTSIQRSLLW